MPRVLLGSLAVARIGSTLPRAGLRALEGMGRVRLDVRDAEAADVLRLRAAVLHGVFAELQRIHRIDLDVAGATPQGPALLVANHMSYLDPLVIAGLLRCAPIAKHEVAGWPVIGSAARALGVLFVRRDDPWSGARVLRESLRAFEAGVSVLCFPEGTTTAGTEPLPFHRGTFGAARLAGVPIVPIALRYRDRASCWTGDDEFLPHYLRTTARERTAIGVRIGAPIEASASRTAGELAACAHERIARLLEGA
jgi:1-acyl-sn-glycerol-3-phosphate acyltransferase